MGGLGRSAAVLAFSGVTAAAVVAGRARGGVAQAGATPATTKRARARTAVTSLRACVEMMHRLSSSCEEGQQYL